MEFRLLGPLEVLEDGRVLELRGVKERALLAVLLLHANETVSSGRLIDELWGERPPASAARLVATYVWQLRRVVGPVIVTRAPGYAAVVSPDQLDAARFETLVARAESEQPGEAAAMLREALALWRGPALSDVVLESSARDDIARLDDRRLSALARRIDHDLVLGRHEDLVAELRALVSAHPFRERYRAQLMLALYRAGRQAEALETYRDARRRFVEELGIEPGPELQRIERAILAHDPELDAPSATKQGRRIPKASAADGVTIDIPRPASSFVGRERELAHVLARVESGVRLLTLTGPGGSGKTRLALEAAVTLGPSYESVFWIGLAYLRDSSLVMETVAKTLDAGDRLAEHIGERRMLLVVDNFEHVIEAAPELASLLVACPNLAFLVTSRERLRIQGEVEYPVPPLSSEEAVSLFCERAQAAAGSEVRELCARLDNLPLAVELAAARAKALSPADMLQRLSQRLDLFTGWRDAEPRHQTLRAAIEWSHDLLTEEEQRLFAHLSVFAGGCTLEAAQEVAGAELETLQSLIEKSLLIFSEGRYRMLETIRQYAAERLDADGSQDEARRRHAQWFRGLAVRAEPHLRSSTQAEWFERLEHEIENIRAALDASIDDPIELELLTALSDFWDHRGYNKEARARLLRALARHRQPTIERADALRVAAEVTINLGEVAASRTLSEEALTLARELGLELLAARCLNDLGKAALYEADAAAAVDMFSESARTRASLGDVAGAARARSNLANALLAQGRSDEAERLFRETVQVFESLGDPYMTASATVGLGDVARARGDLSEARRLYEASLSVFTELGSIESLVATLEALAWLHAHSGDPERAGMLLGATGAIREQTGSQSWEIEQCHEAHRLVTQELGPQAAASTLRRGRALSAEGAVSLAVAGD